MMREVEETITRAALGRFGCIGELYDARTESLSSRSIFKSSLPEKAIQRRDVGNMEYEYKFTENISDRFNLLKVEGELQMGVLCGFVTLDGSGKFLSEERKSEKTVSCTLIFKLKTVCEKFFAAWNEILNDIDLEALQDAKNTHVIVECSWGANCLLSLECSCESDTELKEKKGFLQSEVPKLGELLSIKVKGNLENVTGGLSCKNNIHIKLVADVVPEGGWPTTVEDFCTFMQQLPDMVNKLNDGKGKPLSYVMLPLSAIRKMAKIEVAVEKVVVQISEGFVLSTVYFLDQIATVKRKFNDHISEMDKYKQYLQKEELQRIREKQIDLHEKEANFKHLISDNWTSVRSGDTPFMDFIKELEKAKNMFNLYGYEAFLDSCEKIHKKISSIKMLLSKGIEYLGIGDTFADLLVKNPSVEFVIFITSEEAKNSELYINTFNYFSTLADDSKSGTKFVVIDLDYGTTFLNNKINPPRCIRTKGSQILSEDLFEEHVSELTSNFARPKQGFNADYMTHKPGNRVPLKMICPNFKNNICGTDEVKWTCHRCKEEIEYGFDGLFYCKCGVCNIESYEFRCSNRKHGDDFVSPDIEFLKKMLSKLSPLREMNVLILGQSGVGKSTWINSIVNYLKYETLENAEKGGVVCTIPAEFTLYDKETTTEHTFSVGEKSVNEETEVGNSATQYCHTYSFLWEDRFIRLIDTPGLGDTKGICKDKENIQRVINHLQYYNELHGVCILVKAGDNRINSLFKYCIQELLVNLHKSLTRNIVFCFTNARNALYGPGPAAQMLKRIIKDLNIEKELTLGKHTNYCLDNEAFIFLCSLKYADIRFEEHLLASFYESWKFSVIETKRLFNTIKSFEPHNLRDTITLFAAKCRILWLTPILAEISKTINLNVTAIETQQAEVENSKKSLEQLEKMLKYKEIQLMAENLPYPMTVCTNSTCVNYVRYQSVNITEIEYKTICHSHCYLKNVQVKTINNVALRDCEAMCNDTCKNCKCRYEKHMHITFRQTRVENEIIDVNVQNNMIKEESEQKTKERLLEGLKSTVEEYKKEQDFIIQATVKFGTFLKQNAISPYNDGVADYLEYLILLEEDKVAPTDAEKKLLKRMKETLEQYNKEVEIFENVLKKADDETTVSIDEVLALEKELYNLKRMGNSIRKNVEVHKKATEGMKPYLETPIQVTHKGINYRGNKSVHHKMEKPKPITAKEGMIKKTFVNVMNKVAPWLTTSPKKEVVITEIM